jgi:hypothetical protein
MPRITSTDYPAIGDFLVCSYEDRDEALLLTDVRETVFHFSTGDGGQKTLQRRSVWAMVAEASKRRNITPARVVRADDPEWACWHHTRVRGTTGNVVIRAGGVDYRLDSAGATKLAARIARHAERARHTRETLIVTLTEDA